MMAMLQHYYTSCEKGTTGGAGFQCKAMSSDLSPDDLKAINHMIGYRIPPSLSEYDVPQHPVALRYDYLSPKRCILTCSQSNGTDEKGRPGNFFAHSIVADTQDFAGYPPIMFWRHPSWRTQDSSSRLEIPPEPSFDWQPTLELEQIWSFLDQPKRRDSFYKLLCAVIRYDETKRPIVILDDVDNVAQWIAGVTFALPRVNRPFLTFTTYHHDPYQAPFRIIGTTADSKFRFSSDEYISYFVLNARDNVISKVEDSPFATLVQQNFEPHLYESKLLDFFDWYNNRVPANRGNVAARLSLLDRATERYLVFSEKSLDFSQPRARQSIFSFLHEIESENSLLPAQHADLNAATDLITRELNRAPDAQLVDEYRRALALLKQHDASFAARTGDALSILSTFLVAGNTGLAAPFASICDEIFPESNLVQAVNQPVFLTRLASQLSLDPQIHHLVWEYLGSRFQPDSSSPALGSLIRKTLQAIDRLPASDSDAPPADAEKILALVIQSFPAKADFLLQQALSAREPAAGSAFNWLYYKLVEKVPLDHRTRYRAHAGRFAEELMRYEIKRDVQAATPRPAVLAQLEAWARHTRSYANQQALMSHGQEVAWKKVAPSEKKSFAAEMLASEVLSAALPASTIDKLVVHYFSSIRLREVNLSVKKLYEKHLSHRQLTSAQRAVIGGSLAMTAGKLQEYTARDLSVWLSKADPETYRVEASKLMERFFKADVELDSHIKLIQATYVNPHQTRFWELYWPHFRALLLDEARVTDLVNILSYWFDQSLKELVKQDYVAQGFFLQLPAELEAASGEKNFKEIARKLEAGASEQRWYPLIQDYLAGKKRKFFGLLGR